MKCSVKIEIEGGDLDQRRTFYSTFYRSTLFPRKFYEIDAAGNIIHYSPYNGEVLPGYMYTDTDSGIPSVPFSRS
jgi:putative alpha-1,2-mannosidase